MELFENTFQSGTIRKRYFFVLVWTENFLYLQLFEYTDVILSCNLSSQVLQHGKEYDIFCVLDNIIFFNRLLRAKYCFITPAHKE